MYIWKANLMHSFAFAEKQLWLFILYSQKGCFKTSKCYFFKLLEIVFHFHLYYESFE